MVDNIGKGLGFALLRGGGLKTLAGFTLVEVMIAAVILVIALAGLIAVFVNCFALSESTRNLTIAINDAQSVMEEIRDRNIPSFVTAEDWTAWAQADPPDGGGCNNLTNESVQVTYPSGQGADPLEILVTVSWQGRGSRQRSVQSATLLTSR